MQRGAASVDLRALVVAEAFLHTRACKAHVVDVRIDSRDWRAGIPPGIDNERYVVQRIGDKRNLLVLCHVRRELLHGKNYANAVVWAELARNPATKRRRSSSSDLLILLRHRSSEIRLNTSV